MLAEEWDDESKDFVTFPDYTKRFEEVEPLSFAIFDTVKEGNCQSAIPNAQRYRRVGEETYRRKQHPDYSHGIFAAQAKRLKEAGAHP
jgi:hypothetical protein